MALDFPSPPYDGQIYVDSTSNSKYVYVASKSTWKSIQHVPVVVSYGFNKANSAYLTANAAYDMANAAYNSQNVDYTLSNSAFTHANAAYDFSNSAYASINSNWTVQNALYTVANASFAVANAALPNVSNAVFNGNLRVTGNLQIGSNTITITNNHIIANDYFRMNTGGHMVAVTDGNLVNAVYALVNVSFNTANASYASANNVGPQIAPTFDTANAAYNTSNASFGVANAAYGAANNVGPQIAPAFNTANAAYNTTNASFAKANTALQNTSGVTFNGNFYLSNGSFGVGNTTPGHAKVHITSANTVGGIGYADFLRVTNASYPTVTNPVKTFRLSQSGAIEVINNAYTAIIMQLDDSGVLESTSSMKAPIFYDRDDTGYYLDPNSTSNLYRVNVNGSSLSGSGYTRLVNGVIIQWGYQTQGPDRETDYSFPISFPSSCYGFGVSGDWAGYNGWIAAGGRPISASTYRLYNVVEYNLGVWWIAIGY